MENPYLVFEVLEALCLKMKDNGLGYLVDPDAYTDRIYGGLYKTGDHIKLFTNPNVIALLVGQQQVPGKIGEIQKLLADGLPNEVFLMLAPLLGVKVTI